MRIADWDALQLPARSRRPGALTLTVFGRLRTGATDAHADAQLRSVARELSRAWPATNSRRTASFVPLDGGLPGLPEARALAVVATLAMGMIGVVLLIAVFNVVGLLLSRAVDREREMSVRGALGASRGRLTQQLITESLVIATLAGLVALLVTRWSNDLLGLFAVEAPIPQRLEVTPDWTVALFTGMLMILCGIAAGVWPARRATSRALVAAMAPSTIIGGGRAGTLRAVIVSIQIAGATVLVTLAALLVRNALLTAAVDVGFESERAVVLEIDPASFGYTEAATERFVADAVVRLAALPGVVSASVMDRAPFYVGFPTRLDVSVDRQPCAIGECPTAASYRVGPDYFRTMNIRLRSGRELRGSPEDARSVVISETMARRFWPSENPLGQRFRLGPDMSQVQVVGVAADVLHRAVGERPEPYVYVPFDQAALAQPLTIMLRTVMTAEPLLNVVAVQVRAMDPSLPIYRVRTMAQRLSERQQAGGRIVARFFGICGGLALFLAVVGLSGSIAYAAGQRRREFGIRAAVGASPSDLARLVVGSALRMAGPGIVAGLFAALLLSWLMAARLSGLDLDSPATFALVGLMQLTIAVAAAGVPGLRASRTNALAILRAE